MTREFKFETLQLHAGQVVDATTKSRAVPITKRHLLYLKIPKKVQSFLPFKKLEISILVLPIQQHQPLKSVSLPLKAE